MAPAASLAVHFCEFAKVSNEMWDNALALCWGRNGTGGGCRCAVGWHNDDLADHDGVVNVTENTGLDGIGRKRICPLKRRTAIASLRAVRVHGLKNDRGK